MSQLSNGRALTAAKVITMGLGFVFRVPAARRITPHEVGMAAGVVSAMMLSTELALLGVGSAFIAHVPGRQRRPAGLLETSLTSVAVLGVQYASGLWSLWRLLAIGRQASSPLAGAAGRRVVTPEPDVLAP
jgi:O-antigen/teichoic acid export membrane protein